MVTRYTALSAAEDSAGGYVSYPDYRRATERIAELEASLQAVRVAASQVIPAEVKTADEQAVTDFVLALAKKVK